MSPEFDKNTAWLLLRSGDEAAFYSLYKHFYAYLFHIGSRISRDPGLARDAIHDYFLYLWERKDALPEVRFVTGYITIAYKRRLLDILDTRRKAVNAREDPGEDILPPVPSPEEALADRESYSLRLNAVMQAVRSLPPRQRELILYRYSLGLSHEEIAARTGLSLRSIYNQLNIAVGRLKKIFAAKDSGASFFHLLFLL